MSSIIVKSVRSDEVYKKIMEAPIEKKDDIYRYELMKPFEGKWNVYNCPLKAKQPNGYDVIKASSLLGLMSPQKIDNSWASAIALLEDDDFWQRCTHSIETSLNCFTDAGFELSFKKYLFTIVLLNPESPYSIMCENYTGDGGIPGYIFGSLVPSEYTMKRLPAALAHEANHNVRFQFEKWTNNISLGAYMISEGLAENFATWIYGEDFLGPWVSKTDAQTLNEYIKPLMQDALDVTGFENISAYMYGDELAKMRNFFPVGLPYCAGYACGYYLIKYYLKISGKSIVEATFTPSEEILNETKEFWNEETIYGE